MAKDFWFKFEPGLWLKDSALRRCSAYTRSVWIDIICHMHDQPEQGVLRGWTMEQIADVIQGGRKRNLSAIRELLSTGAASKMDDGSLVCRHMFRRWQISQARSSAGLKGVEAKKEREILLQQNSSKGVSKPLTLTLSSVLERESAERERPEPAIPPHPCDIIPDDLQSLLESWSPRALADGQYVELAGLVDRFGADALREGVRRHLKSGKALGNVRYLTPIVEQAAHEMRHAAAQEQERTAAIRAGIEQAKVFQARRAARRKR